MKFLILSLVLLTLGNCGDPEVEVVKPIPEPPVAENEMDFWLTKGDQSAR